LLIIWLSSAIPEEEQEICTKVPIKERRRIFEQLAGKPEKTR
jgi:hypothetical protein